jgi:hypothetical protein
MTHKIQIDDEIRNATAEEIAAIEANQAAENARVAAQEEKATAKAALLDRLGITAEEAKLLLG